MSDNTRKIVCINLGTRYVGLAAFQDQSLRDWCVKSFSGKWSKAKEKKILLLLSDYLDRYLPELIIFKDLDPARSSSALQRLAKATAALAKGRGLRTRRFSLSTLKSALPKDIRKNRRMLAEDVVRRWPAIGIELQKERSNRNSYYQRMFEAVALGSICLRS